MAGREAATARTVAHLVEIAMIFLQTVAEDNAVNMIEFEAQLSKAKNTIRAYKSDFNDFVLFCTKHGMTSMPTDPKTVSLYLTHLSKNNLPEINIIS